MYENHLPPLSNINQETRDFDFIPLTELREFNAKLEEIVNKISAMNTTDATDITSIGYKLKEIEYNLADAIEFDEAGNVVGLKSTTNQFESGDGNSTAVIPDQGPASFDNLMADLEKNYNEFVKYLGNDAESDQWKIDLQKIYVEAKTSLDNKIKAIFGNSAQASILEEKENKEYDFMKRDSVKLNGDEILRLNPNVSNYTRNINLMFEKPNQELIAFEAECQEPDNMVFNMKVQNGDMYYNFNVILDNGKFHITKEEHFKLCSYGLEIKIYKYVTAAKTWRYVFTLESTSDDPSKVYNFELSGVFVGKFIFDTNAAFPTDHENYWALHAVDTTGRADPGKTYYEKRIDDYVDERIQTTNIIYKAVNVEEEPTPIAGEVYYVKSKDETDTVVYEEYRELTEFDPEVTYFKKTIERVTDESDKIITYVEVKGITEFKPNTEYFVKETEFIYIDKLVIDENEYSEGSVDDLTVDHKGEKLVNENFKKVVNNKKYTNKTVKMMNIDVDSSELLTKKKYEEKIANVANKNIVHLDDGIKFTKTNVPGRLLKYRDGARKINNSLNLGFGSKVVELRTIRPHSFEVIGTPAVKRNDITPVEPTFDIKRIDDSSVDSFKYQYGTINIAGHTIGYVSSNILITDMYNNDILPDAIMFDDVALISFKDIMSDISNFINNMKIVPVGNVGNSMFDFMIVCDGIEDYDNNYHIYINLKDEEIAIPVIHKLLNDGNEGDDRVTHSITIKSKIISMETTSDKVYALDDDNNLYTSTDGIIWNKRKLGDVSDLTIISQQIIDSYINYEINSGLSYEHDMLYYENNKNKIRKFTKIIRDKTTDQIYFVIEYDGCMLHINGSVYPLITLVEYDERFENSIRVLSHIDSGNGAWQYGIREKELVILDVDNIVINNGIVVGSMYFKNIYSDIFITQFHTSANMPIYYGFDYDLNNDTSWFGNFGNTKFVARDNGIFAYIVNADGTTTITTFDPSRAVSTGIIGTNINDYITECTVQTYINAAIRTPVVFYKDISSNLLVEADKVFSCMNDRVNGSADNPYEGYFVYVKDNKAYYIESEESNTLIPIESLNGVDVYNIFYEGDVNHKYAYATTSEGLFVNETSAPNNFVKVNTGDMKFDDSSVVRFTNDTDINNFVWAVSGTNGIIYSRDGKDFKNGSMPGLIPGKDSLRNIGDIDGKYLLGKTAFDSVINDDVDGVFVRNIYDKDRNLYYKKLGDFIFAYGNGNPETYLIDWVSGDKKSFNKAFNNVFGINDEIYGLVNEAPIYNVKKHLHKVTVPTSYNGEIQNAEYIFDSDKNVIDMKEYRPNGTIWFHYFVTHDDDGNRIETKEYYDYTGDITRTEYDIINADGKLLKTYEITDGVYTRDMEYSYDNDVMKEYIYLNHRINEARELSTLASYKYDDFGNKIEYKLFMDETMSDLRYHEEWKYDSNGNMLEHIYNDFNGDVHRTVERYTFDQYCVEMKYYNNDILIRHVRADHDGNLEFAIEYDSDGEIVRCDVVGFENTEIVKTDVYDTDDPSKLIRSDISTSSGKKLLTLIYDLDGYLIEYSIYDQEAEDDESIWFHTKCDIFGNIIEDQTYISEIPYTRNYRYNSDGYVVYEENFNYDEDDNVVKTIREFKYNVDNQIIELKEYRDNNIISYGKIEYDSNKKITRVITYDSRVDETITNDMYYKPTVANINNLYQEEFIKCVFYSSDKGYSIDEADKVGYTEISYNYRHERVDQIEYLNYDADGTLLEEDVEYDSDGCVISYSKWDGTTVTREYLVENNIVGYGQAVNRFDKKTEEFDIASSTPEELSNISLYNILQDSTGNIFAIGRDVVNSHDVVYYGESLKTLKKVLSLSEDGVIDCFYIYDDDVIISTYEPYHETRRYAWDSLTKKFKYYDGDNINLVYSFRRCFAYNGELYVMNGSGSNEHIVEKGFAKITKEISNHETNGFWNIEVITPVSDNFQIKHDNYMFSYANTLFGIFTTSSYDNDGNLTDKKFHIYVYYPEAGRFIEVNNAIAPLITAVLNTANDELRDCIDTDIAKNYTAAIQETYNETKDIIDYSIADDNNENYQTDKIYFDRVNSGIVIGNYASETNRFNLKARMAAIGTTGKTHKSQLAMILGEDNLLGIYDKSMNTIKTLSLKYDVTVGSSGLIKRVDVDKRFITQNVFVASDADKNYAFISVRGNFPSINLEADNVTMTELESSTVSYGLFKVDIDEALALGEDYAVMSRENFELSEASSTESIRNYIFNSYGYSVTEDMILNVFNNRQLIGIKKGFMYDNIESIVFWNTESMCLDIVSPLDWNTDIDDIDAQYDRNSTFRDYNIAIDTVNGKAYQTYVNDNNDIVKNEVNFTETPNEMVRVGTKTYLADNFLKAVKDIGFKETDSSNSSKLEIEAAKNAYDEAVDRRDVIAADVEDKTIECETLNEELNNANKDLQDAIGRSNAVAIDIAKSNLDIAENNVTSRANELQTAKNEKQQAFYKLDDDRSIMNTYRIYAERYNNEVILHRDGGENKVNDYFIVSGNDTDHHKVIDRIGSKIIETLCRSYNVNYTDIDTSEIGYGGSGSVNSTYKVTNIDITSPAPILYNRMIADSNQYSVYFKDNIHLPRYIFTDKPVNISDGNNDILLNVVYTYTDGNLVLTNSFDVSLSEVFDMRSSFADYNNGVRNFITELETIYHDSEALYDMAVSNEERAQQSYDDAVATRDAAQTTYETELTNSNAEEIKEYTDLMETAKRKYDVAYTNLTTVKHDLENAENDVEKSYKEYVNIQLISNSLKSKSLIDTVTFDEGLSGKINPNIAIDRLAHTKFGALAWDSLVKSQLNPNEHNDLHFIVKKSGEIVLDPFTGNGIRYYNKALTTRVGLFRWYDFVSADECGAVGDNNRPTQYTVDSDRYNTGWMYFTPNGSGKVITINPGVGKYIYRMWDTPLGIFMSVRNYREYGLQNVEYWSLKQLIAVPTNDTTEISIDDTKYFANLNCAEVKILDCCNTQNGLFITGHSNNKYVTLRYNGDDFYIINDNEYNIVSIVDTTNGTLFFTDKEDGTVYGYDPDKEKINVNYVYNPNIGNLQIASKFGQRRTDVETVYGPQIVARNGVYNFNYNDSVILENKGNGPAALQKIRMYVNNENDNLPAIAKYLAAKGLPMDIDIKCIGSIMYNGLQVMINGLQLISENGMSRKPQTVKFYVDKNARFTRNAETVKALFGPDNSKWNGYKDIGIISDYDPETNEFYNIPCQISKMNFVILTEELNNFDNGEDDKVFTIVSSSKMYFDPNEEKIYINKIEKTYKNKNVVRVRHFKELISTGEIQYNVLRDTIDFNARICKFKVSYTDKYNNTLQTLSDVFVGKLRESRTTTFNYTTGKCTVEVTVFYENKSRISVINNIAYTNLPVTLIKYPTKQKDILSLDYASNRATYKLKLINENGNEIIDSSNHLESVSFNMSVSGIDANNYTLTTRIENFNILSDDIRTRLGYPTTLAGLKSAMSDLHNNTNNARNKVYIGDYLYLTSYLWLSSKNIAFTAGYAKYILSDITDDGKLIFMSAERHYIENANSTNGYGLNWTELITNNKLETLLEPILENQLGNGIILPYTRKSDIPHLTNKNVFLPTEYNIFGTYTYQNENERYDGERQWRIFSISPIFRRDVKSSDPSTYAPSNSANGYGYWLATNSSYSGYASFVGSPDFSGFGFATYSALTNPDSGARPCFMV